MTDIVLYFAPDSCARVPRLAAQRWWYGEQWSIVDAYINWVWFRVTGTAFDGSSYTNFARHDDDTRKRPAVGRSLRKSSEVAEQLAAQGLSVKFTGAGAVRMPLP